MSVLVHQHTVSQCEVLLYRTDLSVHTNTQYHSVNCCTLQMCLYTPLHSTRLWSTDVRNRFARTHQHTVPQCEALLYRTDMSVHTSTTLEGKTMEQSRLNTFCTPQLTITHCEVFHCKKLLLVCTIWEHHTVFCVHSRIRAQYGAYLRFNPFRISCYRSVNQIWKYWELESTPICLKLLLKTAPCSVRKKFCNIFVNNYSQKEH
jgi:hypothetical protein